MRGSPLFRTLLVLVALLIAGLALARVTAHRDPTPAPATPGPPPEAAEKVTARYELLLSAAAADGVVELGGRKHPFGDTSGPLNGSVELPDLHAPVFLTVRWAPSAEAGHRFARLRLEIPGRETLEHVFTSPGDIDDLWEP